MVVRSPKKLPIEIFTLSKPRYQGIYMKEINFSSLTKCPQGIIFQFTLSLCLFAFAACGAAQTPIRISTQPALYFTLPLHVATANGYWKEAGLTPQIFSYPAGVPQLKGSAEWDMGLTGAVPALIGAKDYEMVTIGVVDDQSRANVLMAPKAFVDKVKTTNTIPKGTKISVSLNSTGDYVAQTCLALWGGRTKSEMVYTGASQGDIIKAGAAGEAELVALWAPNMYTMQEKHNFVTLCSGKDFSPGIFGVIVVKRGYATANPQIVTKFLAVLLRSINWMKENPKKAQELLISTAAKDGITVSPFAAKNDVELRPIFSLKEQLELMGGAAGDANGSVVGKSFRSINIFLNEGKTYTTSAKLSSFIDASYLKRVADDPVLSKIANAK
jgi:ABC-type nitrate/sulfonate/bicarbonate transport system substrate-binding protein